MYKIRYMPAKAPPLTDDLSLDLAQLGERLRCARLRRGLTASAVAETAGITRVTLARIEGGEGAMSVSNLLKVLNALGLRDDVALLAADADLPDHQAHAPVPARRVPAQIKLSRFPQLQRLAWSRDPETTLTPDQAFALYERNWRHVDVEHMHPRERALIDKLTQTVGHGVMLV